MRGSDGMLLRSGNKLVQGDKNRPDNEMGERKNVARCCKLNEKGRDISNGRFNVFC